MECLISRVFLKILVFLCLGWDVVVYWLCLEYMYLGVWVGVVEEEEEEEEEEE